MDALSSAVTIQDSASTAAAVAGLRSWANEGNNGEHCLVLGPSGSGRTHILDATASILPLHHVSRLSPSDRDWAERLPKEADSDGWILVDDLDKYDERFIETVLSTVAKVKARLLATSQTFDGRLARHWRKALAPPSILTLAQIQFRAEDVREYLRRSCQGGSPTPIPELVLTDTVNLVVSLRPSHGFVDLAQVVQDLSSQGYEFAEPLSAHKWIDSYQTVHANANPCVRAILVEGETDAVYLNWVAELALGAPDGELSIEPCGSASKVVERSIACRNEGRTVVSLFDRDSLGKKRHDELKEWGHTCMLIPSEYDPLKNKVPDHVVHVVEIEDLLPVQSLERFHREFNRTPDVEIDLPRLGLKRLVPNADDKLDLARWVAATLGPTDAPKLLAVYNALRMSLSLPALSFPPVTLPKGSAP